jgi:6-phosphogluconolactonase
VPPDDNQSNYKLANETLLGPAKVSASNVHRIQGELDPKEAARRYVVQISEFFGSTELPEFDLIHRGMGPDAHTASLFPGDPLIDDRTGIAASVWVEKMKSHRVTLLPGVLLKAHQTVLQVAGADKAEALFNVLRGPEDPKQYPCQLGTRGSDRAVWFLDKAATAKL